MSKQRRQRRSASRPTRLRVAARTLEKRSGAILISAGLVLLATLLLVAGLIFKQEPPPAPEPEPIVEATIPQPDTEPMEAPVRRRLRQARQAVEQHPDSGAAWGAYGALCDAHGLLDCAEIAYTRATELAADDFRWFYLLGFVSELRGAAVDRVVQNYRVASRLEKRLPTIFYRLGEALTRAGRLDEATAAYEQAVAIDPQLAVAYRGLGQVALAQGRAEEAVEQLQRVLELGGDQNRPTLTSLAQAQMRSGDSAAAEETALRATQASRELPVPDPVRVRIKQMNLSSRECSRRAVQLIKDGQYEEALAQLLVVQESRPDEASTHYRIGLCLARLGRVKEALPHLERAAELAPDNEIVRAELQRAGGR